MEKIKVWRSLFSEYELGGCRELEQLEKSNTIEISKTNPKNFGIENVERLDIISIEMDNEKTIKIYAIVSANQMPISDLLKIKEKATLVTELVDKLGENELFMKTFFSQFINKLYHILEEHKDKELKNWVNSLIKKDIPKKESLRSSGETSYGSSCPQFLINEKIKFEF